MPPLLRSAVSQKCGSHHQDAQNKAKRITVSWNHFPLLTSALVGEELAPLRSSQMGLCITTFPLHNSTQPKPLTTNVLFGGERESEKRTAAPVEKSE